MTENRRLAAVPDVPEPAVRAWMIRQRLAAWRSRRVRSGARCRRDLDVLTDRVAALEEVQDRLAGISADLLEILVQAGGDELAPPSRDA
jgi:hypothetical protein